MTENPSIPASTEKLSIVDKYFLLKKEGRINRVQFLLRTLLIISIWYIWTYIQRYWLTHFSENIIHLVKSDNYIGMILFIMVSNAVGFTLTVGMPYILIINSIKRMHDLSKSWFVLFGMMISSWICIYLLYSQIILVKGDKFGPLATLWILLIGIWLSFMPLIYTWIRKWTPWSNKYGPAPTGKPLV